MAEKFEASKNILPGDPWIRAELKALAGKVMSKHDSEQLLNAAKLKEYTAKVQSLLSIAQNIDKQKLRYRHPYVCDTFVKKIFNDMGNDSLKNVYWSQGIYLAYTNALKGTITATTTFSSLWKKPQAWDLLFFLNAHGTCPHVGIVSEYSPQGITIYDASLVGVGKRTVSPGEINGNYWYTHLAFAAPFPQ